MTNWQENKYPFKDFNEELTELWKLNNFDKRATREWLESGLKPSDYDFAEWLNKKRITPENFLENYDYDTLKDNWFTSAFDEKVSINVTKIEDKGKKVEIWDTSNLKTAELENSLKKDQIKVELLKKLDKGKKIRTRIKEIDPMYWGDIRLTLEEGFRDWMGTEGLCTIMCKNVEPFNSLEVGDLVEIDVEKLNGNKLASYTPLKKEDSGVVNLIEKRKKDNQTENKKMSKQAKLRFKIREQEERIKQLEEELTKEKESKKQLAAEFKNLEKRYCEYVEQNTIRIFK
ncbi:MAG: hypothetical protein MRERV_7c061 [Mycoplasmataceae bacterium RV_VA103A]|nr:MAG: hypothetical protein MRERV_7c061 [Mycoplasmataceae bacterium RV_VA103A]